MNQIEYFTPRLNLGFFPLIGFQRITSDQFDENSENEIINKPEKVLEMYGHIVGVAISPENDLLYVNVRSWPDKAVPSLRDPPCISNQIEMKIIDLHSFQLSGKYSKIICCGIFNA